MIRRTSVSATGAAGGAGTATATARTVSPINGVILSVHLAYLDSPPAGTTDVTIAEASNSPSMPILTVTDAATDGWFHPRAIPVSVANAAITNSYALIPVTDYVSVTIAQANNGDGVTATIFWDDLS
jgi:hypothetical protein